MTGAALAERYAALRHDELPESVLQRARNAVLDQLACMVGGRRFPTTELLLELGDDLGGLPVSAVVDGRRASAPWAAFVNATASHSVELDDTDNSSSSHPGNIVIPAALAVGEATGADGRDVATAIVAGYDAMIRIGRAAGAQRQYERGFHPTATCGVFGAAIAGGLLLGLDSPRLVHALGIAGSFAAGSLEYIADGAPTKPLQVGAASQHGVLAAMLAGRGYSGPREILEGRHGFLRAYAGSTDVETLTAGLDRPFAIEGVSVKAYACCRYCQTPVDAVLQLREREGLVAEDVAAIEVGLVGAGMPIVAEPRAEKLDPHNRVDAQFSLPYSVAVALVRGRAFLDEFATEAIEDPDVRRVMPLVTVHHEEALDASYPDAWPARVVVELRDGRRHELRLDDCKGDPSRPVEWPDLVEKFASLSAGQLTLREQEQIVDAVAGLTALADVGSLVSGLTPRRTMTEGKGRS